MGFARMMGHFRSMERFLRGECALMITVSRLGNSGYHYCFVAGVLCLISGRETVSWFSFSLSQVSGFSYNKRLPKKKKVIRTFIYLFWFTVVSLVWH